MMIAKSVYTNFLSTLRILKSDDLQEIATNRILVIHRGITLFEERKPRPIGLSHKLGEDKSLQIFDCSRANVYTAENREQYLVLPNEDKWADEAEWVDEGDDAYESNSIYIRKSYIEIAKLILDHARCITTKRDRMTLSGTSGTGKSFFIKYFIWILLHPPEGVLVPDIIIWKHSQGGVNGSIYCYGSFYSVDDIPKFVMSSKCKDLVKKRDAWVIYDGEPPYDLIHRMPRLLWLHLQGISSSTTRTSKYTSMQRISTCFYPSGL